MVQDTVMQFATLDGRSRAKADYLRYRADILAVGHFPEYKIKLFWKNNLSAEDIKNKKDLEIWPPRERKKKRLFWEPEEWLPEMRKKYRALSRAQLNKRLLKAMIVESDRIGRTHSLKPDDRQWLIALREKLFAMYKSS